MRIKSVFALLILTTMLLGSDVLGAQSSPAVQQNIDDLIRSNACAGCDLSGADLNRLNLSGADLSNADLSGATLYLADLSGTNLSGANLRGARLGGTDLANANLVGADLRGAMLDGAYLVGALLDGAVMDKAVQDPDIKEDIVEKVFVPNETKPKEVMDQKKVAFTGDAQQPAGAGALQSGQKALPVKTVAPVKAITIDAEAELERPVEAVPSATTPQPVQPDIKPPAPKQDTSSAVPVQPDAPPEHVAGVASEKGSTAENSKSAEVSTTKEMSSTAEINTTPEVATTAEMNTSGEKNSPSGMVASEPKGGADDPAEAPMAVVTQETAQADVVAEAKPEAGDAPPVLPEKRTESMGAAGDVVGKPGEPIEDASQQLSEIDSSRLLVEKLLDSNRCYSCDMSGVDLSGKNLSKADLEGSDLSGALLEKVNFKEANLKKVSFKGANLKKADLRKADLYKADLSDADLTGADLEGAQFDETIFTGAVGYQPALMPTQ